MANDGSQRLQKGGGGFSVSLTGCSGSGGRGIGDFEGCYCSCLFVLGCFTRHILVLTTLFVS